MNIISDGYFQTLRIPLLRGRSFAPEDTKGPRSIIIDQAFAERAFPGQDALGKTLSLGGDNDRMYSVIGIVPTLKVYGYAEEPKLVQAYISARQVAPDGFMLLVRAAAGSGANLAAAVRHAVLEIDPNQPIWDSRTLVDRIDGTFSTARLYTFLLTTFASLALLLAAIGLYGVLAYQVTRRTREFGIRLALGSRQSQLVTLVLSRGMRLLGLGLVIGLIGALALGRVVGSLLYQTRVFDFEIIGGVAALLGIVALLACWLPARRAARVDPITALRAE